MEINNSHHNSSQGYLISTLFQLYQGKLQSIDSIFTLSNHGLCDSFSETLTWKTAKPSGARHPAFSAQVLLKYKSARSDDEDCRHKKMLKNRVFSKTYHWNPRAHRYEGDDRQFAHLQHFNEQNL
jgi:hypothetical protein